MCPIGGWAAETGKTSVADPRGKQATAARSNISIKCEADTASRSTRRNGEERTQFSYLMSLEKKLIWQWNPSCFAASECRGCSAALVVWHTDCSSVSARLEHGFSLGQLAEGQLLPSFWTWSLIHTNGPKKLNTHITFTQGVNS